MAANRIIVTWNEQEGYRCGVWDKDGQAHEVTDIFQTIRGATGAGTVHNQITCKKGDVSTTIEFRAISKRLVFDVPPDVVSQILQMKES